MSSSHLGKEEITIMSLLSNGNIIFLSLTIISPRIMTSRLGREDVLKGLSSFPNLEEYSPFGNNFRVGQQTMLLSFNEKLLINLVMKRNHHTFYN